MGFLDDDSKGFLLSMDLLIAIIPLTIVMGMMVADMDNMLYTVQSSVYQTSLERVGADTVNTLIKTSGSPYNWEEIGEPQIIGLAKYDIMKNASEANYLSPDKLARVDESHVTDLTGPGYGFYLTINTVEDNREILQLGTEPSVPEDIPNIVRIERIVLSSNFKQIVSLKDLIRDAGIPRTYTAEFPTNQYSIEAYDYWVLVDNRGYNSATVDVNNNNVVPSNDFSQHIDLIKRNINDTYMHNSTSYENNIVNVRTVSNPGASMDVYIIGVPKGTPESEINLDKARLKPSRFVFFIWTV
ncbi:MAG: hypothetical protein FGO69_10875 [Methanobacterium sp.]|nr:MAG: hypothetical protein FGO69_10875 [Methanobacterium sp.]